ncbi:hypothetical protein PoB_000401300 [Plakobranchus ocellatus]|uniref:Uncharacterized protein n=1 Tax=Plakobranchus ocellatus TaxID=259542 RepID=A0AAV3Y4M6_9GAST|nr:hypothetical protein PoB_000401300 [Plakobranchus ocellatus]
MYVCHDGGRSIVDAQWRPLDNKVQMSNDCVADDITAQPIRCSLLGPLLIIDAISHLGSDIPQQKGLTCLNSHCGRSPYSLCFTLSLIQVSDILLHGLDYLSI